MNAAFAFLKSRNHPLTLLASGQGVVALANVVYGKATALYIPPTEWGRYSILMAVMMLLHGFLVTPAIQSFKASLAVFSHQTSVRFYGCLLGITYGIVLTVLMAGVYGLGWPVVWLWVWLAAVGQGVYSLSTDYLNVSGQHRAYTFLLSLYALANLLLFGIVVLGFGRHTVVTLWQMLALLNGLFAGASVWQSARLWRESWNTNKKVSTWFPSEILRQYQRYVWPLVSLAGWNWLINYADRYLIRLYLTDADVGYYAMGYSVGSKLLILVTPLIAFLSPLVFQLKADGQPGANANRLLMPYLKRYAAVAGGVCLLFAGLYRWVGQLLLSAAYEPAFVVGPIVAVGYLFLTCIHILEMKWYAYGTTRLVLWHTIVGAVLNCGLNLVLIPRFSIMGAALATLLGFAGQFLVVLWLFKYDAES